MVPIVNNIRFTIFLSTRPAGTVLPFAFSPHPYRGFEPAPREKAKGNTVPAG